jgi:chorismate dehydratase
MHPVRLGYVKYLNTLPLVEGLQAWSDVTLVPAIPSRLADLLLEGQVDLALASVVDAVRHAGRLALVPCGMIGCDGPTLTVRVFSKVPFDRVTTLHADTDSHTSVVLARLVLARRYGRPIRVVEFDARERVARSGGDRAPEWPETLLEIGDKVVTDTPPPDRYPHVLDLGQAWREMTGMAFVYAVWMCRAEEARRPEILTAARLLDRQRRRNTMRLDWLVQRAAAERRWPTDVAAHYVHDCLRYEVTPRAREGLDHFLALAAQDGLLPSAAPVWAELSTPSTATPHPPTLHPPAPHPPAPPSPAPT